MCSLLCCDSYEEYIRLKEAYKSNYIVATNEYEFYKELGKYEEQVIFLECNTKIPYEETWNILDQIHEIVDSIGLEYFRLFHFSYNIQGGFPQKIASMIINLGFIHDLVQTHNIDDICIYDKKNNWVINESIYLYAKSHKLSYHIFSENSKENQNCLKTLEKNDCSGEKEEEKRKLEIIGGKTYKNIKDNRVEKEEIGVLYCCAQPYDKHVDWLIRNVDAIGEDVKVICYYNTEDIKKFNDRSLKTDCVEDYFVLEEFTEDYKKLQKERNIILSMLKDRLKIAVLDVDLSEYFVMKISKFYYREMPDRFYMNICVKNYFKYHEFKYIRVWGDTNFWETWLCYDHTRQSNTKLFKIYRNNFGNTEAKQPYQNMIAVAFIPNEYARHHFFTEEYQGKFCKIPDVVWGRRQNKAASINSGISKRRIALLPTGLLSGFTTYYFYYNTLIPTIEQLLNRGFEVVFKNHPGYTSCWEEDVKRKFGDDPNFIFLDNFQHVMKAIDSCSVIITNMSLVTFDAAEAQRVVCCIVDEQGYSWISEHEKGFLIFKNLDDMIEEIETISQDEDRYHAIIERQNSYMSELMGDGDVDIKAIIRSFLDSV